MALGLDVGDRRDPLRRRGTGREVGRHHLHAILESGTRRGAGPGPVRTLARVGTRHIGEVPAVLRLDRLVGRRLAGVVHDGHLGVEGCVDAGPDPVAVVRLPGEPRVQGLLERLADETQRVAPRRDGPQQLLHGDGLTAGQLERPARGVGEIALDRHRPRHGFTACPVAGAGRGWQRPAQQEVFAHTLGVDVGRYRSEAEPQAVDLPRGVGVPDQVVPGPEEVEVGPLASLEGIVARPSVEPVCASPTPQQIVTTVTRELVVSRAPFHDVVVGVVALQDVRGATAPLDEGLPGQVFRRPAGPVGPLHRFDGGTRREPLGHAHLQRAGRIGESQVRADADRHDRARWHAGAEGDRVAPLFVLDHVRPVGGFETIDVVPRATVQVIGACATHEHVPPGPASERVVLRVTDQRVLPVLAEQGVAARPAEERVVTRCIGAVRVSAPLVAHDTRRDSRLVQDPGILRDGGGGAVPPENVVALATLQPVAARLALEVVPIGAPAQGVVPHPSEKAVQALTALEDVVPRKRRGRLDDDAVVTRSEPVMCSQRADRSGRTVPDAQEAGGIAEHPVRARTTTNPIRTFPPEQHVRAVPVEDEVVPLVTREPVVPRAPLHPVPPVVAEDDVVLRTAVEPVAPGAALQDVVLRAPLHLDPGLLGARLQEARVQHVVPRAPVHDRSEGRGAPDAHLVVARVGKHGRSGRECCGAQGILVGPGGQVHGSARCRGTADRDLADDSSVVGLQTVSGRERCAQAERRDGELIEPSGENREDRCLPSAFGHGQQPLPGAHLRVDPPIGLDRGTHQLHRLPRGPVEGQPQRLPAGGGCVTQSHGVGQHELRGGARKRLHRPLQGQAFRAGRRLETLPSLLQQPSHLEQGPPQWLRTRPERRQVSANELPVLLHASAAHVALPDQQAPQVIDAIAHNGVGDTRRQTHQMFPQSASDVGGQFTALGPDEVRHGFGRRPGQVEAENQWIQPSRLGPLPEELQRVAQPALARSQVLVELDTGSLVAPESEPLNHRPDPAHERLGGRPLHRRHPESGPEQGIPPRPCDQGGDLRIERALGHHALRHHPEHGLRLGPVSRAHQVRDARRQHERSTHPEDSGIAHGPAEEADGAAHHAPVREREQPELRGKSRVVIAAGLFEVLDEGVGEPGDIGGRRDGKREHEPAGQSQPGFQRREVLVVEEAAQGGRHPLAVAQVQVFGRGWRRPGQQRLRAACRARGRVQRVQLVCREEVEGRRRSRAQHELLRIAPDVPIADPGDDVAPHEEVRCVDIGKDLVRIALQRPRRELARVLREGLDSTQGVECREGDVGNTDGLPRILQKLPLFPRVLVSRVLSKGSAERMAGEVDSSQAREIAQPSQQYVAVMLPLVPSQPDVSVGILQVFGSSKRHDEIESARRLTGGIQYRTLIYGDT